LDLFALIIFVSWGGKGFLTVEADGCPKITMKNICFKKRIVKKARRAGLAIFRISETRKPNALGGAAWKIPRDTEASASGPWKDR